MLLAAIQAVLPPGSFYTTDAGANYLLTRQTLRTGPGLGLELPLSDCAGRSLPPEFCALRGNLAEPPPNMFLYRAGGEWRIPHPPRFPWLSAPGLWLAGPRGLVLLPALAALLAALAAAAMAGGARNGAGAVAFLVGLCGTPLLFYGSMFWGHAPAAALVLGGLWALTRDRPVLAGLLVALAGAIRSETLAAVMVVPIAWWLSRGSSEGRSAGLRQALRYCLGAACVLAPMGVFNLSTTGSPFGSHVAASTALTVAADLPAQPGRLGRFLDNVKHYTLRNQRMSGEVSNLLGGLLLAGLASGLAPAGAVRRLLLAAGLLGAGLDTLFVLLVPGQYATGLLLVLPLALVAPLGVRTAPAEERPVLAFLGSFVVLDFLAVSFLAPAGGWQWGPRYLLPALPLVALLGLRAAREIPRATCLLAACSLILQGCSVRDLTAQLQAQESVLRALPAGCPVATDVWFLPWQLLPSLWERTVAFTPAAERFGEALEQFERCGARQVAVVSGAWARPVAGGATARDSFGTAAGRRGWRSAAERPVSFPSGDVVWVAAYERPAPSP